MPNPNYSGSQVFVAGVYAPGTVWHGQTTVGETAVVLASSATLTQGVTIKSKASNTGKIYVGNSDSVTSSTGHILSPGDSVFVACNDLALLYLISDTASQSVTYIGG
jgi:hypothetical protein